MFDKRDKLSQTYCCIYLPPQLSVFSISEGIPLQKHHWADCLYVFSAKNKNKNNKMGRVNKIELYKEC